MIVVLATAAVISASALAVPSRAQSQTAQFITQQTDESLKQLYKSFTFGTSKAFEELSMAYMEFQVGNWDGYGALPVSQETYLLAEHFLKALPLGTKNPTIGAEPDGHLTLEWYNSPRKLLSLSISPEGMLHYAALFGSSKSYGSEPFASKIPDNIMALIRKVPSA
jgi:hypothetical protein